MVKSLYPTPNDYWNAIASSPQVQNSPWFDHKRLLPLLRAYGFRSHDELIRALPDLPRELKASAIALLGVLRVRRAGRALVPFFFSKELNYAVSRALEDIKSRQSYKLLLDIIYTHPDEALRKQACYVLSFTFDCVLVEPLVQIVQKTGLPASVRAQAAEGLANLLDLADRRTRSYKRAQSVLLSALHDPSPEMRFWACFALGNMRSTAALPELKRIVEEDEAKCPNWWLVKDEAADAIASISGKFRPDRERIPDSV